MDSFELNKLLGAVLGCCLGLVAVNIAAGAVFAPGKPAKPGYDINVPQQPAGGAPAPAEQQNVTLAQVIGNADVKRGEASAKKCAACHTFDKGGKPLVGPNLWGVVGRPKASQAGFNYSAAIKGKGGNWTPDDIFEFIASPKAMIPGTAMTFPGLPRPSERADVVAYLDTLSDSPVPLPKAEAAAPATPAPAAAK